MPAKKRANIGDNLLISKNPGIIIIFTTKKKKDMQDILLWLDSVSPWIQIISLVSGIVYMVMQIFQHKWMWYLCLVTATAALLVALSNRSEGEWAPLWAQVLMNAYFDLTALIGIVRWKRLNEHSEGKMHIVPLKRPEVVRASIFGVVLAAALVTVLHFTNDPAPLPDGLSLTLSVIAAWFLMKSHVEQYYLWITADLIVIVLYAGQGAWWMVALYVCYIVSSVIGIRHWRKNGVVIEHK